MNLKLKQIAEQIQTDSLDYLEMKLKRKNMNLNMIKLNMKMVI